MIESFKHLEEAGRDQKPDVPFVTKVFERYAAMPVLSGNAYDEPQV